MQSTVASLFSRSDLAEPQWMTLTPTTHQYLHRTSGLLLSPRGFPALNDWGNCTTDGPPPRGRSLGYCTYPQEAIGTKAQEENWLVGRPKHHRYLSVTRDGDTKIPRGWDANKAAAAPQQHATERATTSAPPQAIWRALWPAPLRARDPPCDAIKT
uniref:Uncharacterized protein n=1 Tax=Eutreptiella gymnastica TaxID=73025 RepID=A0A7S4FQG5_9EUGL